MLLRCLLLGLWRGGLSDAPSGLDAPAQATQPQLAPVRFAVFKERYGLRRLRLFTQARNHVQVLLACCAYTLRRAAGVGAD
ncbi:hypothetical protein GAY31_12430 [Azospirillum brasilense]|nr:hypothetical protein [Azospirillum brasilense]